MDFAFGDGHSLGAEVLEARITIYRDRYLLGPP
jgi:hypothetical protein